MAIYFHFFSTCLFGSTKQVFNVHFDRGKIVTNDPSAMRRIFYAFVLFLFFADYNTKIFCRVIIYLPFNGKALVYKYI